MSASEIEDVTRVIISTDGCSSLTIFMAVQRFETMANFLENDDVNLGLFTKILKLQFLRLMALDYNYLGKLRVKFYLYFSFNTLDM